jgi:flavin-dependent dehydrogenase
MHSDASLIMWDRVAAAAAAAAATAVERSVSSRLSNAKGRRRRKKKKKKKRKDKKEKKLDKEVWQLFKTGAERFIENVHKDIKDEGSMMYMFLMEKGNKTRLQRTF